MPTRIGTIRSYAFLILSYLLALPGWCPPLPQDDPYTAFLKYVDVYSRHWNSKITTKEIENYSWTTWIGCAQSDLLAREYFHISIQETGMHQLDNSAGYGMAGGTWSTDLKALKMQGINPPDGKKRAWIRRHPWETNKALAAYFTWLFLRDLSIDDQKSLEKMAIKWHNNDDPDNNKDYASKVAWVYKFCKGEVK